MTSPATHHTAQQGWQPWMAPALGRDQAGSRVWGRDLCAEVPSGRKSEPSHGSRWASAFAYGELASDLLIHMNGRVYDYRLGRFLSVDPIISNPANSQSINPYSYIGNNPLSGTDPTGYRSICEGTGAASNCSTGLDPNEVVGMKWTTTWKNADGSTGTHTRIEMYGSGASGAGATLANTNPADHLGPRDVSAARQWGRGWGWLTAHAPLGLGTLLPNLSNDPEFVGGRWEATLVAGGMQILEGGSGLVVGTTLTAASPSTGPGAAVLAPAGVAIDIGSAVTAVGGVVNVAVALGHIQEMRGSGSGGGGRPDSPMFGENGTQVTSKTVWKGDGARIDVENPNPGQRPGQIHLQIGKEKYLYDPATNSFRNAPKSVNSLLERQDVQVGLGKAMRILGESR